VSKRVIQIMLAVAGAAVPLIGVLSGSWSLREVVVLYWAENLVIGVRQVVKMVAVDPTGAEPAAQVGKLFIVPFFIVHYGIFCLVHGVFVFAITGGVFTRGGGPEDFTPGEIPRLVLEFPAGFWLALGLIAAARAHELITGFFLNGRWKSGLPVQTLMGEPYKHIVVVHIGILGGAFLSVALGNPIGVLMIIVIGKLLIDLREIRGRDRQLAGEGQADG